MTAEMTVTGNLGRDVELRYTKSGSPVLELHIACTASSKDKQTGEWSDDGAPLWIKAAFWNQDAERLADLGLSKGSKVSVSGTLVRREYTGRDGSKGESLEVRFPRFLGVIPRQRRSGVQEARGGAYSQQPPNGSPSDPWAAQGASYNEQPPF